MRRSIAPAITAVLAACALLFSATPAAASTCPNADAQPSAANLGAMRAATLCLLNAERTPRGLPALRENALLTDASQAYSALMVDRGFFAHVTPDGVDLQARLSAIGYIVDSFGWIVGENLAWGTGGLATPARIMQAWMESPGHRANILEGEFREVGLGIVLGAPSSRTAPEAATYTTDFGMLRGAETAARAPARTPTRRAVKRKPASCASLRRAKARGARLSKASKKRLTRCRSRAARRARA